MSAIGPKQTFALHRICPLWDKSDIQTTLSHLCFERIRWSCAGGVNKATRGYQTCRGRGRILAAGVRAQQSAEVRRVGVIVNVAADDPEAQASLAAFKQAMQQLGWSEGRNLQIDFRGAAGDPEKMQAFAKELVALKPHVILSRSTPVTAALLRQTLTIPIVFTVVSDPVGERFVDGLARPGGNATGFTNVESTLTGKWLELLKEVAPGVKRVAFIFNPRLAPGGGSYCTRLIEGSAPSFAVTPTVLAVQGAADIERAIGEFVREPNGGLVVLPDAATLVNRKLIIELADRHGVPAIYAFRIVVTEGGLMSYGIDVVEQYRQAAG